MTYANLPITQFLDTVAGKEPVPGGGTISALCGAVAAALSQMVAGLTIGRKKYAEVETQMTSLAARFDAARATFLKLADDDAEAYNLVFNAFKLPKDTDEEKAARRQAIERATLRAIEVPLNTALTAAALLDDIRFVADHGNQNAITDACVAMMCARTAVIGGVLNVRINLAGLEPGEYVTKTQQQCTELVERAAVAEQSLLAGLKI